MLSTRQLYRSNNQPASYAALTQFAPEPSLRPGVFSQQDAYPRSTFLLRPAGSSAVGQPMRGGVATFAKGVEPPSACLLPVGRQILSRINRERDVFPRLWIGCRLAVSKLTEYQIEGVSSLAFGVLVDR